MKKLVAIKTNVQLDNKAVEDIYKIIRDTKNYSTYMSFADNTPANFEIIHPNLIKQYSNIKKIVEEIEDKIKYKSNGGMVLKVPKNDTMEIHWDKSKLRSTVFSFWFPLYENEDIAKTYFYKTGVGPPFAKQRDQHIDAEVIYDKPFTGVFLNTQEFHDVALSKNYDRHTFQLRFTDMIDKLENAIDDQLIEEKFYV
jgi:hypothetical protein